MSDLDRLARFGARILPSGGSYPEIPDSVFLSAGVTVIGDTRLGEQAGVWYNSVLRGDVCRIEIGDRTNIQDGCMIHGPHGDHVTRIGADVTVGHNVTLHGCTVEDRCLVGIGAVVLDFAYLEAESMIAAGAVVTPRTRVKSGMLYGGIPARPIRELSDEERAYFTESSRNYVTYAERAMAELDA
jgi:carbonic anhydrase/acetyltransferase-like protein (isoleucine patch superfamily)